MNQKKWTLAKLTLLLLLITLITGCNQKTDSLDQNADLLHTNTTSSVEKNDDLASKDAFENNTLLKVTYLNTGNSDAILIQKNNQSMLIDSGDNDDENFMVNYLKDQGIDKLDIFLLSHFDADHIGGADAVLNHVKVDKLLVPNGDVNTKTYKDFITAAANSNTPPSVPLEGSQFNIDDATIEIFNTDGGDNTNDNSLVVKLTHQNDKFIFMGDASKKIENKLATKIGKINVLKVGHHGSHSSSGEKFIKTLNPEYGIILVGKDNKYGHPHKEVLDILTEMGVAIHRSDECGNIIFTSNGEGVQVQCEFDSQANSPSKETSSNKKASDEIDAKKPATKEVNSKKTVYWTPNGKSYHLTKSCSALSKSKVIEQGTIVQSGKNDACNRCVIND